MTDRQDRPQAIQIGPPGSGPADDTANIGVERVRRNTEYSARREGCRAARHARNPAEPRTTAARRDDLCPEAQLVDQASHVPAARGITFGPDIQSQPADLGRADRPTDAGRRLEHRDVHPDPCALPGRDEPRDPAADDDDPGIAGAFDQFGRERRRGVWTHVSSPSTTECASCTMRVSTSGSVSGVTP